MKAAIGEHQSATADAKEKANASKMALAKLVSLIGNPGAVLIKANLFNEGLKVASDFGKIDMLQFIMIMVNINRKCMQLSWSSKNYSNGFHKIPKRVSRR